MNSLDWAVLIGYFGVMVAIGLWSHKRVDNVSDFFTAGGKMPWWLSGISHHMSGYSAVMFTGYAGIAYTYGVTVLRHLVAPDRHRHRASAPSSSRPGSTGCARRLHVASPLEYLKNRYNLPTQQALAWSGLLLKIVDVGAKWAAIATLLSVFTGISLNQGILITGAITAVYCTIGGLWADALTELGQFVIQLLAGHRDARRRPGQARRLQHACGRSGTSCPQGHADPTAGPYTVTFLLAYPLHQDLRVQRRHVEPGPALHGHGQRRARPRARPGSPPSCGWSGRWSCSSRCGAPRCWSRRRSRTPPTRYALMTEQLLPHGLLGLVVVGFFSHTMAMCSSDANAIAAVFTRDIAPVLSKAARTWSSRAGLIAARLSTLAFLGAVDGRRDAGQLAHLQGHHHRRHQVGRRADGPDRDPVHAGSAAHVP